MDNLEIYNRVRSVPAEAQKEIRAGRLKGMTDINPMWRIKTLTEVFGPCGTGWRYTITSKQIVPGADGSIAAFVDVELCVLIEDKWSYPIPGTGGSMFVAKETGGLHTDDECYKKALTDALSVAAKALGVGADVYFAKDADKYVTQEPPKPTRAPESPPPEPSGETTSFPAACPVCGRQVAPVKDKDGKVYTGTQVLQMFGGICHSCYKAGRKS